MILFAITIQLLGLSFRVNAQNQCFYPEKKGSSGIRAIRSFPDGIFKTVDFFGNLSTYSIQSNVSISKVSILNSIPESQENLSDATFISDTEIIIYTIYNVYKYDIQTKSAVFLNRHRNDEFITYEQPSNAHVEGIPVIFQRFKQREIWIYRYNEPEVKYNMVNLGMKNLDLTVLDMSSIDSVRLYSYQRLNRILSVTYNYLTDVMTPALKVEAGVYSIVSPVIVHKVHDLVVYSGILTTTFQGRHMFRTRDLVNLFHVDVDTYFDFGAFHPSLNVILAYYAGGEFCIIDFDLIAMTATQGTCKKAPGILLEPLFLDDNNFVGYHGANLMLFSYPSLDMTFLYSASPSSLEVIPESKYQLHVYNNLYVKVYNSEKMEYLPVNYYEGKVRSVNVSNNVEESNYFYVVDDEKSIKRIDILGISESVEFQPLEEVVPQVDRDLRRDWRLKSMDFYFEDMTKLLVTYESYLLVGNAREITIVTYSLSQRTGTYYIFSVPNPYRTSGAFTTRNYGEDKDIIAVTGIFMSYYDISQSNPSSPQLLSQLFDNKFSNTTNPDIVKPADPYFAQKIKKSDGNLEIIACFSRFHAQTLYDPVGGDLLTAPDTLQEPLHDFVLISSQINNCFSNLDTDGRYFCYGSMMSVINQNIFKRKETSDPPDYYGNFYLIIRDNASGVGFPNFSSKKFYMVTSEDTYYKLEHQFCDRTDTDHPWATVDTQQNQSNFCQVVDVFNPNNCLGCDEGYHIVYDEQLKESQCVLGGCDIPQYIYNTQCLDHCPFGMFKTPEFTCIDSCSTHLTAFLTFGDMCIETCPLNTENVLGVCICNHPLKANQNGFCTVSCQPYFSMHYQMCQSEIRTDHVYTVVDNDIYCPDKYYFEESTKKCITECPLGKLKYQDKLKQQTCLEQLECTTAGNIVNLIFNECLYGGCPEGQVKDFDSSTCVDICTLQPPQFDEEENCYMYCGNCQSCKEGYSFIESSKFCEVECIQGSQFRTADNTCQQCSDQCRKCEMSTGLCLVNKYKYVIQKLTSFGIKSDVTFLCQVKNYRGEVVKPSEIDENLKEINLFKITLAKRELRSQTVVIEDQFVTFANITEVEKYGKINIKINLRITELTDDVHLIEEEKDLNYYVEYKDKTTGVFTDRLSPILGKMNNWIEIATKNLSFLGIILKFDKFGVFSRFFQTVRTLMRLRYIKLDRGDILFGFYENMQELHGNLKITGDSGSKYRILNTYHETYGNLTKYEVPDNFIDQIPYLVVLYLLAWLLTIFKFIIQLLVKKNSNFKLAFISFLDRFHFAIFNIIIVDGIFFGAATIINGSQFRKNIISKLSAYLIIGLISIDILKCLRIMLDSVPIVKKTEQIKSISESQKKSSTSIILTSENKIAGNGSVLFTENSTNINSPIKKPRNGRVRMHANTMKSMARIDIKRMRSEYIGNRSVTSIDNLNDKPHSKVQVKGQSIKKMKTYVEEFINSEQIEIEDIKFESDFSKVEKIIGISRLAVYNLLIGTLIHLPFITCLTIVFAEVTFFIALLLNFIRYNYISSKTLMLTKLLQSLIIIMVGILISILTGVEYYEKDSLWEQFSYNLQLITLGMTVSGMFLEYFSLVYGVIYGIFVFIRSLSSKILVNSQNIRKRNQVKSPLMRLHRSKMKMKNFFSVPAQDEE